MTLKSIDVAIGMTFLYLLLTFVASAVVELISNVWNWRARMLYASIEQMLADGRTVAAATVYEHPLVTSLTTNRSQHSWVDLLDHVGWKPPHGGGTPPSYIPGAIFSAVVLEEIRKRNQVIDLSPDGEIRSVVKWLASGVEAGAGRGALHSVLETAVATQGNSIQAVRLAIEKWFNDTMERTSGWYKRRTQSFLLIFGAAIALLGNIDSIAVAKWLWEGDAARQAVVTAAADFVRKTPPQAEAPKAGASSPLMDAARQVADVDRQLADLHYPVGFPKLWAQVTAAKFDVGWLFQYLMGALISAIAISMGSSFWFDALQNLLKMRGSGPKPGPR